MAQSQPSTLSKNVPAGEPQNSSLSTGTPSTARRFLWQGKVGPAFWTVASLFSLAVNIFLVVVLLLLARQLFGLKSLVAGQLVGGLHENFVKMDDASIVTTITVSDTIQVNDTIPVVFDLPLNQATEVRLVDDTPVNNAVIFLNGSRVPLNLVLRKGTRLNIKLDMTVPVNQNLPVTLKVPVRLQVPVNIPLNQTQLHEPFVGLQGVVAPYDQLLSSLPSSWQQISACRNLFKPICSWLFSQ